MIADTAEAGAQKDRILVTGPEEADARDLARTWRSVTGRRTALIPVVLPGKLGWALRAGVLTSERPAVRGTVPFADWLAARQ